MAANRDTRKWWVELTRRIAEPVLAAAAEDRLTKTLPLRDGRPHRPAAAEAICRTLTGLAPWLEAADPPADEADAREHLAEQARRAIANLNEPDAGDYRGFDESGQLLVEAAFFSHAMLRAPTALWSKLEPPVQQNVIANLERSRRTLPHRNNWLLFSAMVEAALHLAGREADRMRINYAVGQHEQWYKGDGTYGDGPALHHDYYNSFVIQPMMLDVVEAGVAMGMYDDADRRRVVRRARRCAAVLERMISPEGAIPPLGRSLAYRFGCLQLLGQVALRDELPDELSPAQARCGMTAAMRRLAEAPGTFDAAGWLTVGFAGEQPAIGERYISRGSVYLCSAALLPLGLSADHPFWADADQPWTSRRIYDGQDVPADHALHD